MQDKPVRLGLRFTAGLAALLCLAAVGCTSQNAVVTRRTPAPATVGNGFSPGIGGPGPDSADTRGSGGVALGEAAGIPDGPATQPNGNGAGAGTVSPGH
jgi:hypothetical protein